MAKIGKIEKHNLGPRILEMLTQEGFNSVQIAARLTKDGFKLSQPTVSRWIKENREQQQNHAKDLIRKHVDREIPKDLNALEDMELHTLAWASEEPETKAERISTWERVLERLDMWADEITQAALRDMKGKKEVVKAFVGQCLTWLMEEHGNQEKRLAAMRMATNIIEVKLRHAGIIEGLTSGHIYIGEAEDPSKPKGYTDDDKEGRRLFVIRKGEPKDA